MTRLSGIFQRRTFLKRKEHSDIWLEKAARKELFINLLTFSVSIWISINNTIERIGTDVRWLTRLGLQRRNSDRRADERQWLRQNRRVGRSIGILRDLNATSERFYPWKTRAGRAIWTKPRPGQAPDGRLIRRTAWRRAGLAFPVGRAWR